MKKVYIKSYLKSDKLHSDKSATIYIRVTIDRKSKYLSTGIRILPKNWNKGKIKSTEFDYITKNSIVERKIKFVNSIIDKLIKEEALITFEIIESEFKNNSAKAIDFYDFVLLEINKRALSAETKRTYNTQISKLKQFKPTIKITDINFDFIQSYKNYMIAINNLPNTYYKSLSMLKTFLNWCIEKKLLKNNPFENIHLKKMQGNRQYLTPGELEILENLYFSNSLSIDKSSVLRYFLFSCYTGLRFTDVKNLKKHHFYKEIIDNTEVDFITINMHKTGYNVTIPVIPKAKRLINLDGKLEYEKIFTVRCNQVTNRRLKEIIKNTSIDKTISFHCSRHTFATVAIEKNIPIETISKILGHTELRTTQIYAKITQSNKYKQMLKLE